MIFTVDSLAWGHDIVERSVSNIMLFRPVSTSYTDPILQVQNLAGGRNVHTVEFVWPSCLVVFIKASADDRSLNGMESIIIHIN